MAVRNAEGDANDVPFESDLAHDLLPDGVPVAVVDSVRVTDWEVDSVSVWQALELLAPVVFELVLGAHAVHAVWLGRLLYVFGGHRLHARRPVRGPYDPGRHGRHAEATADPLNLLNVPGGHMTQSDNAFAPAVVE